VLARLLDTRHDTVLVLTRPDQAAGRGLQVTPSAVKRFCVERGFEAFQPATLKSPDVEQRLHAARVDLLVVVAYGLLVPSAILAALPLGAVNVHASLLPRWRGAAPIQRALLAGDHSTGVSVMKMDAGLDTGPLYEQRALPIAPDEDAGSLHDKLAALGSEALVDVLDQLQSGRAQVVTQSPRGATYAAKIDKRETQLDWRRSAAELERAVRAFRPSPGASAQLDGERIKVWNAQVTDATGEPGMLLDPEALIVACGSGALRIRELQRPGGRRLSSEEFVRGRPLERGTRLQ
jgi:methionyl-tRNA formyltransferase